jgi:hypothetical protein
VSAVAHNVLLRKLGLVGANLIEIDELTCYIDLFMDGLSEEKVKLVGELFTSRLPHQDGGCVKVEDD